jgi:hypothetical protein
LFSPCSDSNAYSYLIFPYIPISKTIGYLVGGSAEGWLMKRIVMLLQHRLLSDDVIKRDSRRGGVSVACLGFPRAVSRSLACS